MDREHSAQDCYHCGESVPQGLILFASIDGQDRPMCCPGCQAVAQLIHGKGLDAFYTLRTAYNQRPDSVPTDEASNALYDDPAVQQDFVVDLQNGECGARLLVSGISCAACTWLIEQALGNVAGVCYANVNLSQHSLELRWRSDDVALSTVFTRLQQLGYEAWPWQAQRSAELVQQEQRQALRQLAVAGLAMMQVGMFAIALHAGEIQGIADEYRSLMRWVSLIISSVVVLYAARSFFRNAWVNLRQRHLVMDFPVALAIGLAWSASAYATLTNSGQVYFDSVAMFTFFLLLGRFLERRIRQKDLLRQTDLQALLPPTVKRDSQGTWQTTALREVAVGDRLLLTAGTVVPADGEITDGSSSVDESAFSGENFPRNLGVGDQVSAGTLLLDGSPQLRVTATGENTRLAQMLEVMSLAQQSKPRAAVLADRVAAWFVAILLLIATAVAVYWLNREPSQALWITLSVLVVSCPCALALATPAALASTVSALRRRGLLLSGENALEELNRCDTVFFDKTGTLTRGQPVVKQTVACGALDEGTCLEIAAALEQHSNHPIARAFSAHENRRQASAVETIPASGVSGVIGDLHYAIGRPEYTRQWHPGATDPPDTRGHWICLVSEQETLAWFELGDELRDDAGDLVNTLKARGLRVELLSGDSSDQGPELARKLNLDAANCGFDPQQKLDYIRHLQAGGQRIAMVGDGLNDAPVLAAANCSFAVAGATDLAKARADGIILNDRLATIDEAFALAQRCRRTIRQNLSWALVYNLVAIPLAAMGLVPPWAAAIGMSLSSLLVVINSLRIH